jgi:predicted amidohydrolase YtcJ
MGGDLDVDYLLEAIERGSKEAGFTPEQIRAKRHAWDHLTLSPRPDQIERLKKLGMAVGGAPFFYMQNAPQVFERYGEQAVQWSVPKKALIDAQVPTGFEIDRPLATTSLTVFWTLARFIDRKAADGKVYAPNQRISRELALKSATTWGAYYLMKEDQLGALEPGKLADFIVLDRDYLTIPEEEIENVRVLLSVVGGKVRHLVPSLARKWGMQATGAQVELSGPAAQW